ncbi:putative ferric-chelate reductase 1 isoform X4 [Gadus chalcogrammus]|uniref:putative ferric-chelate reductase 1 isoform X4 n=1 Tax=Gadus chalcogrammus TaxID=1042646 RepID=UPI0024C4D622|nr:putative ferric-chelate reductase 1 isoform X4 [Gadus chalcogrammus]
MPSNTGHLVDRLVGLITSGRHKGYLLQSAHLHFTASDFPFLMGTLHGFVALFFGLQIITHAMGFSVGGFFQSCTSLLPDHSFNGVDFPPQNSDIPFEVNAIAGEGESIIVSLGSRSSAAPPFRGFMVDVRKSEIDPANGSFVEFGPGSTGLTCNGIQDSAVTQNSNIPKTFVQVKWQAQENGSSSFFLRATFVQDFVTFWSPVNVTIQTPASTTKPSTTTLTSKPSTEKTSTEQPSTEQTSTTLGTNQDPKKLIFALSISSLAPASLNNLTIQTAIEKAIRALINETMGSGDLSYMVLTFKIK